MSLVVALTKRCPWCNNRGELALDLDGFRRWRDGELVQYALPDLSPTEREQLITGLHPACQDALYGEG